MGGRSSHLGMPNGVAPTSTAERVRGLLRICDPARWCSSLAGGVVDRLLVLALVVRVRDWALLLALNV